MIATEEKSVLNFKLDLVYENNELAKKTLKNEKARYKTY